MIDIDTLLGRFPLEERIYRLRCVEAWSMVIPWVGFPLGPLIKQLRADVAARSTSRSRPSSAPDEMPGQRTGALDWPYVEGLRMDEAMHPLTILAVGLYGRGAAEPERRADPAGGPLEVRLQGHQVDRAGPLRRDSSRRPAGTGRARDEYGFYSNVNPEVDHPRWSQATERRIGELRRRQTLPFNGYGEQVAGLYAGMDLRKYF